VGNGNGHNGNYTAAQFIKAIEGSAGIVTTIAKRVGCAWNTAKKYINKMPTVRRAYQDECEAILDLAETKLLSAINEGDGIMIRYYLSTKGKQRGYTERTEISGPDGGPIKSQDVTLGARERNRAVAKLAEFIATGLLASDPGSDNAMGTAEHSAVDGAAEPGG
jgi:hypothetical protein